MNNQLFNGMPALSVVNHQIYLNSDAIPRQQAVIMQQPGMVPTYTQVPGQPMYAQVPGQPTYAQPGQPMYAPNQHAMMPMNQAQIYPAPQQYPVQAQAVQAHIPQAAVVGPVSK